MLQSGHGTRDGRTNGQTDGVKPIYPPTTSLFGGYNNLKSRKLWTVFFCNIWLQVMLQWSVDCLTHWGRDKMDAILQTTFSTAFSWMKMFEFQLIFHWSLFLRVQLTIFQHWFSYWLGAVQAKSHYLNQCWLVYRRICVSLGLNELIDWWIYWLYCISTNPGIKLLTYPRLGRLDCHESWLWVPVVEWAQMTGILDKSKYRICKHS